MDGQAPVSSSCPAAARGHQGRGRSPSQLRWLWVGTPLGQSSGRVPLPQLTQSTSSVWQLRRHSAPGVPTEALLQSRYTMGATHPEEGGHAGRPRSQGPLPPAGRGLSHPHPAWGPRAAGWQDGPQYLSLSAQWLPSSSASHAHMSYERRTASLGSCPLPHRPAWAPAGRAHGLPGLVPQVEDGACSGVRSKGPQPHKSAPGHTRRCGEAARRGTEGGAGAWGWPRGTHCGPHPQNPLGGLPTGPSLQRA